MRRRLCVLALAAALALVACGDDDDGGSADAASTTAVSTTSPTETAPADPAGEVDAFCAKTDELQALIQGIGAGGEQPTPEEQQQLSDVGGQAAQMMMTLQASVEHMLPSDVARFQECSAVLAGGGMAPPGP